DLVGPPRGRLPEALRNVRAAPAVRPGRRRLWHVPERRGAVGGVPRPLLLRERLDARPARAPLGAGSPRFRVRSPRATPPGSGNSGLVRADVRGAEPRGLGAHPGPPPPHGPE